MHPIHHTLFGATATHAAHTPRGAFALQAGRAMTLSPKANAVLRITQGAAWVTLPSQPGDHFLHAGDSLRTCAFDRVVIDTWQIPATESLYFDWDPVPMQIASPRAAAVRQPLADLRAALVLGAGALARLTAGLLALALGGLAARARTAHSSANAAQGCIASGESIASSGAL